MAAAMSRRSQSCAPPLTPCSSRPRLRQTPSRSPPTSAPSRARRASPARPPPPGAPARRLRSAPSSTPISWRTAHRSAKSPTPNCRPSPAARPSTPPSVGPCTITSRRPTRSIRSAISSARSSSAKPSPKPRERAMNLPLEDLCLAVRDEHRRRTFWMEQRKRGYLALGAYLRVALGWERDAPLAERNAIADRAQAMVDYGEAVFAGKEVGPPPDDYVAFAEDIVAALAALQPALKQETGAAKEMERLAQT